MLRDEYIGTASAWYLLFSEHQNRC